MGPNEHKKTLRITSELQRRRRLGLLMGGYTWPIRKNITEAGGVWDSGLGCWLMPDLETIDLFGAVFDTEKQRYIIERKKEPQ